MTNNNNPSDVTVLPAVALLAEEILNSLIGDAWEGIQHCEKTGNAHGSGYFQIKQRLAALEYLHSRLRAHQPASDAPGEGEKWYGFAGHFIGGADCAFHLCTRVNGHLISTVGHYIPKSSGGVPKPLGAGDDLFETYVFRCDGEDSNGDPNVIDWSEIDGERYANSKAAEEGHYRYLAKYRLTAAKAVRGNEWARGMEEQVFALERALLFYKNAWQQDAMGDIEEAHLTHYFLSPKPELFDDEGSKAEEALIELENFRQRAAEASVIHDIEFTPNGEYFRKGRAVYKITDWQQISNEEAEVLINKGVFIRVCTTT